MKILHTSDWHVGKVLKGRDRHDEHVAVLRSIAATARDEDVDVVGLSILSGSHLGLVPDTLRLLREVGVDAPVVVGGIIPDADRAQLEKMGVSRVYTPKDYRLSVMMRDLAELARQHRSKPQAGAA